MQALSLAVAAACAARRCAFAFTAGRYTVAPAAPPASTVEPSFLVVVACWNESEQVSALLASVAQARYPSHRVSVLVVDDASQEGDARRLREVCGAHGASLVRHEERSGKGHAIRRAIDRHGCDADIVLVMDVDHRLDPAALLRLRDYFADATVGAVALKHAVRNGDRTAVSRYCELEAIVNEDVTARAKDAMGLPVMLGGVWALRGDLLCLYDPPPGAVIDDVELSARLHRDGHRIRYAGDAVTSQEVPETLPGFLSQHLRWSGAFYRTSEANIRTATSGGRRPSFASTADLVLTMLGYVDRPALLVAAAVAIAGGKGRRSTAAVTVLTLVGAASEIATAARIQRWPAARLRRALSSLRLLPVDVAAGSAGLVLTLLGRRIAWTPPRRRQLPVGVEASSLSSFW